VLLIVIIIIIIIIIILLFILWHCKEGSGLFYKTVTFIPKRCEVVYLFETSKYNRQNVTLFLKKEK
jgi:vancomycin permeability regulator SanA